MNWYVLFVRGGKEEKILSMLNKKGFHAFLPRMEVIYRKQGKSIIQKKLMFPNYVSLKVKWIIFYLMKSYKTLEWSSLELLKS